MAFKAPDDPRERIELTKKLIAFYRDPVRGKVTETITPEMIEDAIACGFDRTKLRARGSRRAAETATNTD